MTDKTPHELGSTAFWSARILKTFGSRYTEKCFDAYYHTRLQAELSNPAIIEAVAKAQSQWFNGENWGTPMWKELSEENRNKYRDQAKAALAVLRGI